MLDADALAAFEQHLGHTFRDRELLRRALTHASYAHEHPPLPDNASLALLGDAVLALVVTERLWRQARDAPVGVLTSQRAELVAGVTLARWAERLELGPRLRLGRGEELSGGRDKDSVLATAFEAVLGAVYVDGGLAEARAVVARFVV
ncbi:MAG: ribonuclease III family protein [Candidatus Methylomirabilia bacterium]